MSENTIFGKWDKQVDLKGLVEDVKNSDGGSKDFEKVPHGDYEVKINKLELVASKAGDPMVKVWYKILDGDFKNSLLFQNQVITKGFQIHIVKELLNSFDTGLNIDFESYTQFGNLLLDVAEEIETQQLEYAIRYEDNKGYDKFTVTEVFSA